LGARLWELSKDELRRLIEPRPDYADIRDDWDRPFRERRQRQDYLLDSLPEHGRYGVVWMELY